ncbi:MAG TPA: family 10 glycosylhydrolase, partial [Prevotella sp.]
DVDGIHLDYIRYPETWKITVPRPTGRRHITTIVEQIHRQVKASKPWIKMSCSPIGKFDDLGRYWSHGWNAYTKVCQDAQGWLRDGLMDALFPMMYFKDNQFFPFAIDWSEQSYGRIVAPGLGIYFLSPKEKNWPIDVITQEMNVLRQYGMGHAYFRGRFLTDNTKGIYTFASEVFDKHPALVPAMTWQYAVPPTPPTAIHLNQRAGLLGWSGATDRSGAPYILYNVYASSTYPVDVTNAANLVAPRIRQTQLTRGIRKGMYYAVTAMDRYGNESAPLQSHTPQYAAAKGAQAALLPCNGRVLKLPATLHETDATFLTIETLAGTVAGTSRRQGSELSVSHLPNGMYTLRTLNKKGVSHRMGYFIIKRTK